MLKQPQLLVIGGPNGAGKTTSAMKSLRGLPSLQQFVNADEIARGLSPLAPDSVALTAGKLMLRRVEELRAERRDFAIESTLSGRTYVHLFQAMQQEGYRVMVFYVWLSSAELSLSRIAARVNRGGHNIPSDVARRRYALGVRNMLESYLPIADDWWICDNSREMLRDVASGGRERTTTVYDAETFGQIQKTVRG